ncbi:MFS transporter [Streptomyces hiroshimensis]|uniref:MFS transporter n=1 Tax=Streptomyces hiroshimensis TaxID=66424 RepID=UPI00167A6A7B|nr:MFS transporter [Streptomyces hiroshimensis]
MPGSPFVCHLALLCGALAIAAPTAAVPAFADALRTSPALTQWCAAGYQLTSGPLQLGAGHLADRYGARRVLPAALALFATTSLLAATAGHGPGLLTARLAQGAAGSVLSPVSLSLLIGLSPDENEERRAVGGWVATAATASCLGPLLGGLLTSALGWRAVFGALALLAVVTAACALTLLPGRTPHSPRPEGRLDSPEGRLDGVGIALCTATATMALIALTAPTAGAPPIAALTAVAAAGVLLAALLHRARHHQGFVLDSGLLRRPATRRALFVLLVLFCANSLFTYLTYFELTRAHALDALQAALVTLPAVAPAAFTGRWAARRTATPGAGPRLMRAGLLCIAAGLLAGGLGGGPAALWLPAGSCAVIGCGLGLANGAAMTTVAMGASGTTGATSAAATATTFAMLGSACGPALAGAATSAAAHLPATAPGTPAHLALCSAAPALALTAVALTRSHGTKDPAGWGPLPRRW